MLINGKQCQQIDAMDRGLAYGDGLFSTIKVEHGQVIDWPLHLNRFKKGCERLFFPELDWLQLQQEVFSTAQKLTESSAVIKVILTRGIGGRGYSAQGCDKVQRIIMTSAFPQHYLTWQQQGIQVVLCESQLGRNKQLAGLKSLARLEQVLIKQELISKGVDEGLVCDELGNVIEGCASNLFVYKQGVWLTPKLDHAGVAGVKRQRLMMQSRLPIRETNLTIDDINEASCLCLTNALMGVVPVRQFEQRVFSDKELQPVFALQQSISQGSE